MAANASFMGWQYDHLGRLIRLGKTLRTRDWSVMEDTTLPSWLSVTGTGTASVAPLALGGGGYCRLTAASGSATNTSLSSIGIDPAVYSEMGIYVDDLTLDTDATAGVTFLLGFGVPDSNFAGYYHVSGGTYLSSVFSNSVSNKEVVAGHTALQEAGSISRKKSLGVIYRPIEKAVYLVGNDNQVLWRGASTISGDFPAAGVLTPRIGIYNSDSAAHYFQFSRIRVELVSG